MGALDFDLEKAITTGYEGDTLPSVWQTFVKDIAPDIQDAEAQNAILSHFSRLGWELVNVVGPYAYFKRVNPEWEAWAKIQQRRRTAKKARR